MEFGIGIACGACDEFNPVDRRICAGCGSGLWRTGGPAAAVETDAESTGQLAYKGPQAEEESLMEQARNYVCRECSSAVPSGHKFCGTCGAGVPAEVVELRTKYFGTMQTPGKARLILIRGDAGVDGLSYMLQGSQHVAGREDGQILFPEDAWLSPRHANFVYDSSGQLVVHDEGSLNGIYLRVRERAALRPGDLFLCGEQLFRLDGVPEDSAGPSDDQTYFYSSPRKPTQFRVSQLLVGGDVGMVFCATGKGARIGREDCDLNFPTDIYLSSRHAHVERTPDGKFTLYDNGSKNGTYLRVAGSAPLAHGDYLFLGKQLLRVEMTA